VTLGDIGGHMSPNVPQCHPTFFSEGDVFSVWRFQFLVHGVPASSLVQSGAPRSLCVLTDGACLSLAIHEGHSFTLRPASQAVNSGVVRQVRVHLCRRLEPSGAIASWLRTQGIRMVLVWALASSSPGLQSLVSRCLGRKLILIPA